MLRDRHSGTIAAAAAAAAADLGNDDDCDGGDEQADERRLQQQKTNAKLYNNALTDQLTLVKSIQCLVLVFFNTSCICKPT